MSILLADTIRYARVKLLMDSGFLGLAIKDMPIVRNDDIQYVTTDGISIFFNNDYAIKVNADISKSKNSNMNELKMLKWRLGHISVHITFGHIPQSKDKITGAWNAACDIFADNFVKEIYTKGFKNGPDYNDLIKAPSESVAEHKIILRPLDELYKLYLMSIDPRETILKKVIDKHNLWNTEYQGLWDQKLIQNYHWVKTGPVATNIAMRPLFQLIEQHLPDYALDKAEALNMMQILTGDLFGGEYTDKMTDMEITDILLDLCNRSPEDFALIAKRIINHDNIRSRILTKPEWIMVTQKHKEYIM